MWRKKDIAEKRTQDLIRKMMGFTASSQVTKTDQKEFFWVVEELVNRNIIENEEIFIESMRGLLRRDCLPERYNHLYD